MSCVPRLVYDRMNQASDFVVIQELPDNNSSSLLATLILAASIPNTPLPPRTVRQALVALSHGCEKRSTRSNTKSCGQ